MCVARLFPAVLLYVATATAAGPSLHAVYRPDPPSIAVTASDSGGLDSIQLSCPSLDLTYTTQLSRAAADKRFERDFVLRDVFRGLDTARETVRVTVTVRNTRGAAASATVAVPLAPPGK